MKKAMIFFCLLLLVGCGGDKTTPSGVTNATDAPMEIASPSDEPTTPPERNENANGFVFVYNGTDIYMDENMADVLEKLGEPQKVFNAPSCAFEGEMDRVFSYPSIEIRTYPKGGADYLHMVDYVDDIIGTPEGIYIGSSLEDVLRAYGNEYEDNQESPGLFKYIKDKTYLELLTDDSGMVIRITYALLI